MALNRTTVKVKKDSGLRNGYGFSLTELKEAKLSVVDAKRLRIPFDRRRKSNHPFNVEALNTLAKAK